MSKSSIYLVAFASVFLMGSCAKQNSELQEITANKEDLSSILVPESRLSLFADISRYNLLENNPETKVSQETYSLESLLDFEQSKTMTIKEQTFTQIPFRQNRENILASIQDETEPDLTQASVVKKYYVEMQCPDGVYRYVTTLVTSAGYSNGYRDFDFLYRPNYTGAVLYSSLQGEIIEVRTYLEGRILKAKIFAANSNIPQKGVDLQYINLFKRALSTKSGAEDDGWDDEIEASICIGHRPDGGDTTDNNWDDWINHYEDTDDDSTDNEDNGGGGGGNDNWSWPPEGEFSISLSCNVPEMIQMEGNGNYCSDTYAFIGYHLTQYVYDTEFQYWTGDFQKHKTATFLYKVTQDVVSTAYFDDNPPCRDSTNNKMNPLKEMRIAATKSGSYLNGTYMALRGNDKKGKPVYHRGMDFFAEIGTPIYSMYTGVIKTIEDSHKDKNEDNSFGNIVVIEHELSGYDRSVYLQYSHLNYGTPVAVNPRTGDPFKVGDVVYQGDLFAYTGKTGNAWDDGVVPNKHLDLMASYSLNINGKIDRSTQLIDPLQLLNGTFDIEGLKTDFFNSSKAILLNQKCD